MIYVDQLAYKKPGGRKLYCHMFADATDELHEFAAKIGRKRCWYHKSANGIYHYDLDDSHRTRAVLAGALQIQTKVAVMAKKLSRSIEEYMMNDGWSSKLFVGHAKHCFSVLTECEFDVGRSVIYIKSGSALVKAYPHHNGRSHEWVTFTDDKGKELETVHFTATHDEFVSIIRRLLNGEV